MQSIIVTKQNTQIHLIINYVRLSQSNLRQPFNQNTQKKVRDYMFITNESVREYLASAMPERVPLLEQLHREATKDNVPIIKHEMEQFLSFIIKLHKPKTILEIGTAIGYSSIVMSEASIVPSHITTLEKSEKMIARATSNIEAFGYSDRITIVEGDAEASLATLSGQYDMIFIDAAKGQYMTYYKMVLPMLKEGGLLIADNVLQDGLIAKSRYAIPRRQRTIHARMREFIKTVNDNKDLSTSVLPIADGATISLKLRSSHVR